MSKYDHNQVMLMFELIDLAQIAQRSAWCPGDGSPYLSALSIRQDVLQCINDLTELSQSVHQANIAATYKQGATTQLEFAFQDESKKRAEDILLQSRLTGNRKILHCDDLPPRQDQSITLWKRPVYVYWPDDARAGFGLGIQVFDSCRNL